MTGGPERTPGTTVGPPTDKPRRLWQMALLAALGIQLIVLYFPQAVGGPHVVGLDKVTHVIIFAVPALAALMAGISRSWALGILALHAPVSELIQHHALSQRSGDVLDVVADLGGVALAATVYVVWSRRQP